MDKRFFLFIAISMAILIGSQVINAKFFPPPEQPVADVQQPDDAQDKEALHARDPGDPKPADAAPGDAAPGDAKPRDAESGGPDKADPAGDPAGDKQDDPPPAADAEPGALVTLGSLDPTQPWRMLVTLTNRGAAIRRLELNGPRYHDMEDDSGYLGHLAGVNAPEGGCQVGLVGPGTPADIAGVKLGDIIVAINDMKIQTAEELTDEALPLLHPGDQITLTVERDGKQIPPLKATLINRPLEIMRPELANRPLESFLPDMHDQLSILMTFSKIDQQELTGEEHELDGVQLHDANWKVTSQTPSEVTFERPLPDQGLTVVKRYRLAEVPTAEIGNQDYKAYHLLLDLEVINHRDEVRTVAYHLDGPTGLPTEGWWYSRKISRSSAGSPLRDIAAHSVVGGPDLINTSHVVTQRKEGEHKPVGLVTRERATNPLAYIGVETQYFAAILIPDNRLEDEQRYKSYEGIVVGDPPRQEKNWQKTNVTSRVTSEAAEIQPNGRLHHTFQFFTGPKRRDLLEQYVVPIDTGNVNLSELIYYGWPIWGFFSKPLSSVLHFFYGVIPNYGIAIILLTIGVRLCMFPLSRKQALNAQKMQELQPEMKRISEKYKGDMEKRSKALQDLYRKHKYNPLSGCAPLFIQLPIFIGLYRAVMTDVELRQAPLISESISWCKNLSAPDMFWKWDELIQVPFLTSEAGWLGPYLNVLPLITVCLFVVQQKMFMPPPTDDQAAMQQKIMKYMMVLMGFFFFKVPSGLCVYFIASSLWGLGERKLLPKMQKSSAAASPQPAKSKADPKTPAKTSKNGSGDKRSRNKQRSKK